MTLLTAMMEIGSVLDQLGTDEERFRVMRALLLLYDRPVLVVDEPRLDVPGGKQMIDANGRLVW